MTAGHLLATTIALGAVLVLLVLVLAWRHFARARSLVDLNEILDLQTPQLLESAARRIPPFWLLPPWGEGCLALYRENLIFLQWFPRHTSVIRRRWIRAVEGRSGRLVVTWAEPGRPVTTTAWRVHDVGEWVLLLGGKSRTYGRAGTGPVPDGA